ncbi:hypothetical protein [Sneathiella sp.]|uniref:hypothetical protein n=1 Tax=Sneathiella sp. TaxID=1964365 RepID=UPI0039E2D785
MEKLENEIGTMRVRIENLHLGMVELRDDVKALSGQVSMGRGALKFVGLTGTVIVALITFIAWLGQTFKPFGA